MTSRLVLLCTLAAAAAESGCDCTTLPRVYDEACADPDSHPYHGLGCNAEGKPLCRFEIMDCDGDDGNAEWKQPCYEDKKACATSPLLGCSAAGHTNLRFCGFGKYKGTKCPRASPAAEDELGVLATEQWVWDAESMAAEDAKSNPVPEVECACDSQPCYFDAACADPDSDPNKGLGCNAEGKPLCRFKDAAKEEL